MQLVGFPPTTNRLPAETSLLRAAQPAAWQQAPARRVLTSGGDPATPAAPLHYPRWAAACPEHGLAACSIPASRWLHGPASSQSNKRSRDCFTWRQACACRDKNCCELVLPHMVAEVNVLLHRVASKIESSHKDDQPNERGVSRFLPAGAAQYVRDEFPLSFRRSWGRKAPNCYQGASVRHRSPITNMLSRLGQSLIRTGAGAVTRHLVGVAAWNKRLEGDNASLDTIIDERKDGSAAGSVVTDAHLLRRALADG